MGEIASLYASIGADTSGLKAGLEESKGGLTNLEKTMTGTRSMFGFLNNDVSAFGVNLGNAGGLLKAFGVNIPTTPMQLFGEAVQFAKESLQDYISLGGEVRKMAAVTGMPAEEASRAIHVFEKYGVSYEMAIRIMSQAAKNGYPPTIEGLAMISDSLLNMSDANERAAKEQEIFSRGWYNLAPLMMQGGQAIRDEAAAVNENLVLTKKQTLAAKDLQFQLHDLNETWEGVKVATGGALSYGALVAVKSINLLTGAMDENTRASYLNEIAKRRLGKFYVEDTQAKKDETKATDDEESATHELIREQSRQTYIVGENTAAEVEHERQLLRSAKAMDGYANDTQNAAIQLGVLSNAAAAQVALDNLTESLRNGKISEDQYIIGAEGIMRGIGGMSQVEIDANLKMRDLQKALNDGKITAGEYAGMIANINRNLDILNGKTVTSYIKIITQHSDEYLIPGKGKVKQEGGPVSKGESYLVGEKGPELFIPYQAGKIVPSNQVSSMGRQEQGKPSVVYHQIFNISDPLTGKMIREQMRRDKQAAIEGRL